MKIEIYTADYCPWCKRALKFFDEKNIDYTRIRIDSDEDNWREKLGKMFDIQGDVTVPQIIIDGKRIGGYTDLMEAVDAGELNF